MTGYIYIKAKYTIHNGTVQKLFFKKWKILLLLKTDDGLIHSEREMIRLKGSVKVKYYLK